MPKGLTSAPFLSCSCNKTLQFKLKLKQIIFPEYLSLSIDFINGGHDQTHCPQSLSRKSVHFVKHFDLRDFLKNTTVLASFIDFFS